MTRVIIDPGIASFGDIDFFDFSSRPSGAQLLGQEELHALTDALALLDLPGMEKSNIGRTLAEHCILLDRLAIDDFFAA